MLFGLIATDTLMRFLLRLSFHCGVFSFTESRQNIKWAWARKKPVWGKSHFVCAKLQHALCFDVDWCHVNKYRTWQFIVINLPLLHYCSSHSPKALGRCDSTVFHLLYQACGAAVFLRWYLKNDFESFQILSNSFKDRYGNRPSQVIQNDKEGLGTLVSVCCDVLSGSMHISWVWFTGATISYALLKWAEAEGGEDTVGWRRAQLSALISHTGQPAPPSVPSDPLNAPHSFTCRHLQPKRTANCERKFWTFTGIYTQFQLQVGLWLACCTAAMQHRWKIMNFTGQSCASCVIFWK